MTLFMDDPQEKNVKKNSGNINYDISICHASSSCQIWIFLAQLYCGHELCSIWKTNAHNKYNMWTKKFKRCRAAVALLPKFIQNVLGFIVIALRPRFFLGLHFATSPNFSENDMGMPSSTCLPYLHFYICKSSPFLIQFWHILL